MVFYEYSVPVTVLLDNPLTLFTPPFPLFKRPALRIHDECIYFSAYRDAPSRLKVGELAKWLEGWKNRFRDCFFTVFGFDGVEARLAFGFNMETLLGKIACFSETLPKTFFGALADAEDALAVVYGSTSYNAVDEAVVFFLLNRIPLKSKGFLKELDIDSLYMVKAKRSMLQNSVEFTADVEEIDRSHGMFILRGIVELRGGDWVGEMAASRLRDLLAKPFFASIEQGREYKSIKIDAWKAYIELFLLEGRRKLLLISPVVKSYKQVE